MAMKDMDHLVKFAKVTTDAVDLQGYNSLTIFALGDGTNTGTIAITHCDTVDGVFDAVGDGDLTGPATGNVITASAPGYQVGYIGNRRYVKVAVTMASSGTSTVIGMKSAANFTPTH